MATLSATTSEHAPLEGLDLSISSAITAWLHALGLIPSADAPLEECVQDCVPLCKLMCRFAPNHFSRRDFFNTSGPVSPTTKRQGRYNSRRLTRALAEWYGLTVRSSSPGRDSSAGTKSSAPPVHLAPALAAQITMFTETDVGLDSPMDLLAVSEVALCAAVHCAENEAFIKAVIGLPMPQQDLLQLSIKRTFQDPETRDEKVLRSVSVNDENRTDSATQYAQQIAKGDARLTASVGIPLADYKALAAERDVLRKKLANSEKERSRMVEDVTDLKGRLDEAGDKVLELGQLSRQKDSQLEAKTVALVNAQNELRQVHVAAEEVDVLKSKAATVEQLQASLQRATKRLEENANLRHTTRELETQLSAFRENEERINKHNDYIELQLRTANERVQQFAVLSDNLTNSVEDKERDIAQLKRQKSELSDRLEIANKQLASMFVSSTNDLDDSSPETTPKSAATSNMSDSVKTVLMECSRATPVFDENVVCDHLFDEIGVRLTWSDIVESVKGIMDAMKEMNDREVGAVEDDDESHLFSSSGVDASDASLGSHRSEVATNNGSNSTDVDSGISVLPAFSELDSKLLAANSYAGDEFDFAANQMNVQEIALAVKQEGGMRAIPRPSEKTDTSEDTMDSSGYSTENTSGYENARNESGMSSSQQPSGPGAQGDNSSRLSSLDPSKVNAALQCSMYRSLLSNGRATSLTISVLGGLRRKQSRSENTRTLVREARLELDRLQKAIEMMRAERQASSSISTLVTELDRARKELMAAREELTKKEADNKRLRDESSAILREMDTMVRTQTEKEKRDTTLVQEKERLVLHLQQTLKAKTEEVKQLKVDIQSAKTEIHSLQQAESSFSEKLQASAVIARAQEMEVARLNAKLEANEALTKQLNAITSNTEGLSTKLYKQRESHIESLARREKELAQEARDEALRVAKTNASVLDDVRATAAAAAFARGNSTHQRSMSARKNSRFGDFWRKLLHLNRTTSDYGVPDSTSTLYGIFRSPRNTKKQT